MDLQAIIQNLKNCPCGRTHAFDLKVYEADRGLVHKVGEILKKSNFPKKIYIVTDENAIRVSKGILESLDGFDYELKIYPDMRYAYVATSKEIMEAAKDFDGILSIGTGSVNDVCRYAAAAQTAFELFQKSDSIHLHFPQKRILAVWNLQETDIGTVLGVELLILLHTVCNVDAVDDGRFDAFIDQKFAGADDHGVTDKGVAEG